MNMATSEDLRLKFRAVLLDKEKFDDLIEQLGATDLIPLLVKFKGLEKIEGDELKAKLKGQLGRKRNRVVIDRIMSKDTPSSYKALSQVVQFKNEYIWAKMFPFAKGTHGALTVQPLVSKLVQPAAHQPAVIWWCADKHIFRVAAERYCKSDTPLKSMSGPMKYYELPLINDYGVTVWVCFPDTSNIRNIDIHKLYQTYCNSKYCVYTGECTAFNNPDYQLGDICVTKKTRSCMAGFSATIEHKTREWELNNKTSEWFCDGLRSDGSQVVFGELGGAYSDNRIDFVSSDALHFCEKSEEAHKKGAKKQHVAVLMATKDKSESSISEWCGCKERSLAHVVDYSHKLVEELVLNLSLSKCRSGHIPLS